MRPQLHCISSSCQFVVSASGDYSMHSGDPDRLVDWDRIEQVVSTYHLYSDYLEHSALRCDEDH